LNCPSSCNCNSICEHCMCTQHKTRNLIVSIDGTSNQFGRYVSSLELCCNTHLTAFYYHRIPMSLNFTARFSRSRPHNSLHIILAALVPLHLHPSGHSHTGRRPLRTWLTWLLLGNFYG
jgi:hypothetical protein